MQFFTLGSSKMEVFETCFFDILTTQNDHPRYVKHVLGRIYMFLTLFGYLVRGGGGGSQGIGLFSHFCYVGGFGDLVDPVVPTLRGVSGDIVTVYAY